MWKLQKESLERIITYNAQPAGHEDRQAVFVADFTETGSSPIHPGGAEP